MLAGLAFAPTALRLASPVMQDQPNRAVQRLKLVDPARAAADPYRSTRDRYAGAAEPFSPLGSAAGGSSASGAALQGMSGAVLRGAAARAAARAARVTHGAGATSAAAAGGASVQFMITRAMRMELAALGYDEAEVDRMQPQRAAAIIARGLPSPRQADNRPTPAEGLAGRTTSGTADVARAAATAAPSGLVDKKRAITKELGLSGNLPAVASGAASELGIDPNGKSVATLINECYSRLFE